MYIYIYIHFFFNELQVSRGWGTQFVAGQLPMNGACLDGAPCAAANELEALEYLGITAVQKMGTPFKGNDAWDPSLDYQRRQSNIIQYFTDFQHILGTSKLKIWRCSIARKDDDRPIEASGYTPVKHFEEISPKNSCSLPTSSIYDLCMYYNHRSLCFYTCILVVIETQHLDSYPQCHLLCQTNAGNPLVI